MNSFCFNISFVLLDILLHFKYILLLFYMPCTYCTKNLLTFFLFRVTPLHTSSKRDSSPNFYLQIFHCTHLCRSISKVTHRNKPTSPIHEHVQTVLFMFCFGFFLHIYIISVFCQVKSSTQSRCMTRVWMHLTAFPWLRS